MAATSGTQSETIGLKRSLRFRDLVLYGIILIQPTAPMPVFGVIYQESRGHVVTAILLAMVAMLFTSVSYGRMARVYPHGGSAFLYVGKEIHPSLGYITGWCLVLDYVINPLICTIWCSRAAMNFLPEVPYIAWAIFFALLFTVLNCNGVETSARINAGMAAALGVVIVLVLIASIRWVLHIAHPTVGIFLDPLLRSRHLQFKCAAAWHIHRSAHLHRFRRHIYAHRRGKGSCPQRSPRHRAHLPHHRDPGQHRGLRRAARVAARCSFP